MEKVENLLCPLCQKSIIGYPAISRRDNKTKICSNCAVIEALDIFLQEQRKEIIVNGKDDKRTNNKPK